jgi:type IV secretory pathway VirB2 component (pilin)
MSESLQRPCGPWRCARPNAQGGAEYSRRNNQVAGTLRHLPSLRGLSVALCTAVLLAPAVLFAQAPWERAAGNLERTFTGPLARSLALVAIVIGGLMFMFGESGAKRQISGIVFGGGLALFAAQFLTWLF